jgi:hypothetical protein
LKNSRLSKKEIYAIKTGIILDNIVKKPKEWLANMLVKKKRQEV